MKIRPHYVRLVFWALLVSLSLLLVNNIWLYLGLSQENRYIKTILSAESELPPALSPAESAEKHFAYAARLARERRYDEAAESYSQASRLAGDALQARIFYNLGNLYLKQAITQAEKLGVDSAMAFTDAAKSFYRRALRIAPDFWQAKYNYETAQRLVRDLPLAEVESGGDGEEEMEDLWSAMPGFPAGLP